MTADSTVREIFEAATAHHRAGRLSEAETLYRRILTQNPNQPDALHLLGVVASQVGHRDAAVDLIRRAIAMRPNIADYYSNLGLILNAQGKVDEAYETLQKAIALNPKLSIAWSNLGSALKQMGRHQESIAACQHALALKPDSADAYNNLGNTLNVLGRTDEAINAYRQALVYAPQYPEAHSNIGSIMLVQGKLDEAAAAFARAIELRPGFAEAHSNMGNVRKERGELNAAIACYERALEIRPEFPEAQNNLAVILSVQARHTEAMDLCRAALRLKPNHYALHNTLGKALYDTGHLAEATDEFRESIRLKPDYPMAHWNLGVMLLTRGQFSEGWIEQEWRWRERELYLSQRKFDRPLWTGEDLTGRTILLHAEQGLGDTIQFVRYLSMVRQRNARIVLEAQGPLRRLLSGLAFDQWLTVGEALPAHDCHCPLLSLPFIFSTTLETIPKAIPYLHTDEQLAKAWAARLDDGSNRRRVGLVWAGAPGHPNDRNRSLPAAALSPLANIPGVRLISLQKSAAPPEGLSLDDWTSELKDFADTAALMANLDLIVTADTSTAHLAGAMGKPVWMFVPFVPDWRWMLDRQDSPWYPTMRLFRQRAQDAWPPVVEQLAQALRQWVETGGAP